MRLSAESHREVEQFFRSHEGRPGLVLPPVYVHAGLSGRVLTRVAKAGAITFGRHVFVRPSLVGRDSSGRVRMGSALLVHEAAHVLQYERRGWARFFARYLRGYFRELLAGKGLGAEARKAAYLAIPEERAAREAERAYAEWRRDRH